jgi:hypothetical protein
VLGGLGEESGSALHGEGVVVGFSSSGQQVESLRWRVVVVDLVRGWVCIWAGRGCSEDQNSCCRPWLLIGRGVVRRGCLRGKTSELLCMADGREVEFAERRRRDC